MCQGGDFTVGSQKLLTSLSEQHLIERYCRLAMEPVVKVFMEKNLQMKTSFVSIKVLVSYRWQMPVLIPMARRCVLSLISYHFGLPDEMTNNGHSFS